MVEEILKLLCQKEELLKKFEKISEQMISNEIEELLVLDEERMKLIAEMQSIDKMIKSIYENESDADSISRAISNLDNRSEVNEKYLPIFDKAQQLFMIVSKLQSFQENLDLKLLQLKKELLGDIKQNNQSGKVVKYLNAMDQQMIPTGSLISSGNRKI
ncbi:MAG: hypothetical protein IKM20_00365 [Erysipelotrichales bacterium]|nr:hypothetical protein [Erysipelotrichales bacterium]